LIKLNKYTVELFEFSSGGEVLDEEGHSCLLEESTRLEVLKVVEGDEDALF